MFLDRNSYISKSGKEVKRAVLRHSYREDGVVKKKNIANLSSLSDEELDAIEIALKSKKNISELIDFSKQEISTDKYFGALNAVIQIFNKLKISTVLEKFEYADIIKWLIFCRLTHQSSVSQSFRLKDNYFTQTLLSLENKSINDFYKTYEYLSQNQQEIENQLFKKQKKSTENIFLYDVTSSYLEGLKNELSDYGYNRDKKKGKKQIVYGLLTDSQGDPLSVEAFRGNTNDMSTFSNQIAKLKTRFNCQKITLIGDKGMIKSAGIEEIEKNGFFYLTSITKEQIKNKIAQNGFQLSMFENQLVDLCDIAEKTRYVLRRNPVRQAEIRKNRKEKFSLIKKHLKSSNQYLSEHDKAKTQTQINAIKLLINKYKFTSWLSVEIKSERELSLKINISSLKEAMLLDGCYALKTNLLDNDYSTENLHQRYKDLAMVEKAFRIEKTAHLQVRPIYLRKEQRTRAHLFIVMLAYKIFRFLQQAWLPEKINVKEGLLKLNLITTANLKMKINSKQIIVKPNLECQKLLNLINVKIPSNL
jgi:transposase